MTYQEQLQDLIVKAHWRKYNLYNSVIVFDIERDDRRDIFYKYLSKTGWLKFQTDLHKVGGENYDYVLFDNEVLTVLRLYNALKTHNGKILVFNNDMVLREKGLLGIIEGGVCSNPETNDKWSVNPEGKREFMFKGSMIILTSLTTQEFLKKKKYEYLKRDCQMIF
jgi:hypothetical protein